MHVDFVVPGFSKCGSTTLCALLDRHPDIHMGMVKESSYFSYRFDKGPEWYEAHYADRAGKRLIGDGSVGYATGEFAALAAERLSRHSPEARLIFIARDPIARLESSFREMHNSGWLFGVTAEADIGETLQRLPNMMADTRYWRLLSAFREYFSDRHILIVFLDRLELDPAAELRRCFRFLGVDPAFEVPALHDRINPGSAKRYDSRLMRLIRHTPLLARLWAGLPVAAQDRLTAALRLRPAFRGPVAWRPETLAAVEADLAEDSAAFLNHAGQTLSKWPWVARRLPGTRAAS